MSSLRSSLDEFLRGLASEGPNLYCWKREEPFNSGTVLHHGSRRALPSAKLQRELLAKQIPEGDLGGRSAWGDEHTMEDCPQGTG